MTSTFFGLEIGRKALQAQTSALDVTGHNIANANTEGYTRQRAVMTTTNPFAYPSFNKPLGAGQLGTGVQVEEVKRLRDDFIDSQTRKESSVTSEWENRKNTLDKLQVIINEPSDSGLRTVLDQFWESLQTLSTRPEDRAVRATVRQRGIAVADTFRHMDKQLEDLQVDLDQSVDIKVGEVNNISSQILSLNKQIVTVEISGDHANDLRDKRDLLIDQLAKLTNIDTREDQHGAVTVTIGGRVLVSGTTREPLTTAINAQGFLTPEWSADNSAVNITSGELQGLIYSRDTIAQDQRTKLNTLATNYINKFNAQHRLGYGLVTNVLGATGVSASVTSANLPTAATLNFTVPQNLTVSVDGGPALPVALDKNYPADLVQFNADLAAAGINATASFAGGKFCLASNSTGTTSSISISGPAFSQLYGTSNPFFTGTNASDIQVDPIIDNTDNIAAAATLPLASGDNVNALALVGLKHDTSAMTTATFDDYFRGMAAQLGVDSQAADRMASNQGLLMSQFDTQRQQLSGVSLDEEMTNMIKFQHAYNSAARVVTSMDEMLDTIVNRLGLVGR